MSTATETARTANKANADDFAWDMAINAKIDPNLLAIHFSAPGALDAVEAQAARFREIIFFFIRRFLFSSAV